MNDAERKVTELTQNALLRYPGGMRAAIRVMGLERAYSTIVGDLNPNSMQGRLKVDTLIKTMEITGDLSPLHFLNGHFGQSATSFLNDTPDAPTVEAEMLQDYPALVNYHNAVKDYTAGKTKDLTESIEFLEAARRELNETLNKAIEERKARWPMDIWTLLQGVGTGLLIGLVLWGRNNCEVTDCENGISIADYKGDFYELVRLLGEREVVRDDGPNLS